VSLLGAQGADINYIADQVGHTTTRLTQNLYTHVLRRQPRPPWRGLGAAIPSHLLHVVPTNERARRSRPGRRSASA
jgi:hypothetical protein